MHSLVRGAHWWQIAKAVPYLIQHDADLELQNARGQTPFNAFLERVGHVDFSQWAVEALLQLGANVKSTNLAKTSHQLLLTEFFLKKGAIVTPEALVAAIESRNCEVFNGSAKRWRRT